MKYYHHKDTESTAEHIYIVDDNGMIKVLYVNRWRRKIGGWSKIDYEHYEHKQSWEDFLKERKNSYILQESTGFEDVFYKETTEEEVFLKIL